MLYPAIYRRSHFPKGERAPRQDVACYELGEGQRDPVHGVVTQAKSSPSSKEIKARLRRMDHLILQGQGKIDSVLNNDQRSSLGQRARMVPLT